MLISWIGGCWKWEVRVRLLQLNPQHTVPILVDDDFVIWDSHAIAGYLVGQYAEDDTLYPKDDVRKRAVIDQRLHFENGVLYVRCCTASVSWGIV